MKQELSNTQQSLQHEMLQSTQKQQEFTVNTQRLQTKIDTISQQNKDLSVKLQDLMRLSDEKLNDQQQHYERVIQDTINDKDTYYQHQIKNINDKNQMLIDKINEEHKKQIEKAVESMIIFIYIYILYYILSIYRS